MKDIPVFSCTEGIATLILREVPTRGEGFVLVRAVFTELSALLREGAAFCRAVGARRVYASGEADFSAYPLYTGLVERSVARSALPPAAARAVPVAEAENACWTALYNRRFAAVPAARSLSDAGGAYWVLDGEARIGLGRLSGDCLEAVAALVPHRGADCVSALAECAQGERLRLLCARENLPAMRLYDRLGFSEGEVRECWYAVE